MSEELFRCTIASTRTNGVLGTWTREALGSLAAQMLGTTVKMTDMPIPQDWTDNVIQEASLQLDADGHTSVVVAVARR